MARKFLPVIRKIADYGWISFSSSADA